MNLIEAFPLPHTVSVIGTGRESGKTTTCSALLALGRQCQVPLGLVSAGKGGSATPLMIPGGSLVALAKNCELTRKLEILEETKVRTPWGEILIGRARQDCEAEMAGPVSLDGVIMASRKMHDYGAQLVFVDGTLARKSFTSSKLCDSFVLAVGADPVDPQARKKKLHDEHELLIMPSSLHEPPDRKRTWLWFPTSEQRSGTEASSKGAGRWQEVPSLDQVKPASWKEAGAVYVAGVFSDSSAEVAEKLGQPKTVLLEEPWHLFAGIERRQSLKRAGWIFQAVSRSRFAFVVANPRFSDGRSEDPLAFLEEIRGIFHPLECVLLK